MITFSVGLICASAITAQLFHYSFIREEREHKDVQTLGAHYEQAIASIDELKKKVDALTVRAGFR